MPIYEVVMRGSFFTRPTVNRWNYVASGSGGTANPSFGLLTAMGGIDTAGAFPEGTILGNLQDIISAAFHFVSMQVKNVYDPTDFYEAIYTDDPVGVQTGDALSPINAYGFVSTQTRLDVAKGHKRFAGCTEASVDSGGSIKTADLAGFTTQAELMGAVLSYTESGAALAFSPAIVSKEKITLPTTPPKIVYRYYEDADEQLEHTATPVAWAVMSKVRSQVSRQYK